MLTNEQMTTKQAAAYIGKSESWLNKSRPDGTGPVYYKNGAAVRYEIADLDAWLKSNRRTAVHDHANDNAAPRRQLNPPPTTTTRAPGAMSTAARLRRYV